MCDIIIMESFIIKGIHQWVSEVFFLNIIAIFVEKFI